MRDFYSPMAEFYEIVAERQAASSGPALAAALAGVDPAAGPVVEIGAGTGRVTEIIAAAAPGAAIVAAEPSTVMRAVLTSRVAADDDLRNRVTVVDGAAPDLDLPEVISAAVLFGVAGHLDEPARRRLWSRLRDRLAPGGVIVVELMGVRQSREIPPALSVRDSIGRHDYEWWVSGTPGDGLSMRFTTTWRVYRAGRLLREVSDTYDWHTVDVAQLSRESGLSCRSAAAPTGAGAPEVVVLAAA
ncbi:class I SAM-dependent methyltransferase [Micromonospora sp. WMMD961]|uniref:class I SAM-dependent methyltransferase n=1 Tax=Micromonospora sp. WMMD961 TaxID=3016100 RepID=UPI00241679FB|nr:class I SAM-dependent methyltransferase [Micromonospora sp. WMMD961]MDG4782312.1 class I SAM-dependent methyltransferase [Micromonospora sp. WMMD961]